VLRATSGGAPFSFDAAGLRVTAAGISVARDDLDAVRSFLIRV